MARISEVQGHRAQGGRAQAWEANPGHSENFGWGMCWPLRSVPLLWPWRLLPSFYLALEKPHRPSGIWETTPKL